MSSNDIQWLTHHFNIEYMFRIALEQLQKLDDDELDLVYHKTRFLYL